MRFCLLPLLVPIYFVTSCGIALAQQSSTVAFLGDSNLDSVANAINDYGEIVGWTEALNGTGGIHAFLWSGGNLQILGSFGDGNDSYASGINNFGQVVGAAQVINGATHAFIDYNDATTGKRVLVDIGTLGGFNSFAFAINDKGQVVGQSDLGGLGGRHAFLWQDNVMHDLGTLGGPNSVARFINNKGIVVGESDVVGGHSHAFLYDGKMRDLGSLGGNSYATGVNAFGDIVGSSELADPTITRAFLYTNGAMQKLGTLGGLSSLAFGINDSNLVVGHSGRGAAHGGRYDGVAFLFSHNKISPVPNLDFPHYDSFAYGVNNHGQIVGSYVNAHGFSQAFLYSP